MAQTVGPITLAPAGSTGNNTHTAVQLPAFFEKVAAQLVVEAVGATPTITWKLQGALVPEGVTPATTDFFDLMLLPTATDTGAATFVATAVGASAAFLPYARDLARWVRMVTSANTNVTYRGELYGADES